MTGQQEPFSVRSGRALQELSESDAFSVEFGEPDPNVTLPAHPSGALELVGEKLGAQIAGKMLEHYFPEERVHAAWQAAGEPVVYGEFCLLNIVTCLTKWRPPLEDPVLSASQRGILASLRVMDQEPYGGSGRIAGLRIVSSRQEPEIWFYDMSRSRLTQLDMDYGTYLDMVLVAKGAGGWQYLFADVDMSVPQFHEDAENLQAAFALFSEEFPQYSYEDLRSRLEARR